MRWAPWKRGGATEIREERWALRPDFDFPRVAYIGARRVRDTGFRSALLREVEIRWPTDDDVELIACWWRRPEIHRALGFPIPPRRRHLRLSVLPDLTGGTEPVELLVVRHRPDDVVIGFLVVYEERGAGRPELELDLAIASEEHRGDPILVRRVKLCVLSYLFAVRGAERVSWVRRKRDPGSDAGDPRLYPRRGRPIVVTVDRFRRWLQRLAAGGDPSELPVLCLRRE